MRYAWGMSNTSTNSFVTSCHKLMRHVKRVNVVYQWGMANTSHEWVTSHIYVYMSYINEVKFRNHSTLQYHTGTVCNSLQYTATHCNSLHHMTPDVLHPYVQQQTYIRIRGNRGIFVWHMTHDDRHSLWRTRKWDMSHTQKRRDARTKEAWINIHLLSTRNPK